MEVGNFLSCFLVNTRVLGFLGLNMDGPFSWWIYLSTGRSPKARLPWVVSLSRSLGLCIYEAASRGP